MSPKQKALLELRRASTIITRIATGEVKLDDVAVSAMLASDAVDDAIGHVEDISEAFSMTQQETAEVVSDDPTS